MDRTRKLSYSILISVSALLSGCTDIRQDNESSVEIVFDSGTTHTKALDPDEEKISDVSLLIFDKDGNAEECIWIPDADQSISVTLIEGNTYKIRACANFGYQIYADHIDELDEITYHMAYPDEYREGIPMYASVDNFVAGSTERLRLHFKRLMAKICIRMDRSRLSDGVTMNVVSARIGNCPKVVDVVGPSKISSHDQCFSSGFLRNEFETDPLNTSGPSGVSGEVSLYVLENMQGDIYPPIKTDNEKVFSAGDYRSDVCTYLEMEIEYMSTTQFSSSRNLIYRFYLGDSLNNLDVERNCRYTITVRPEGDGLSGDGWRVDKSGITDRSPVSFTSYPTDYIRGNIGDKVHIWCEFHPSDAPFDVGKEYMEDDKREGIYDYAIDENGHGATLTLTGPGCGLIYMEAGDPVNEAALFIIEVNLPDTTAATDTWQYGTPYIPSDLLEYRRRRDFHPHHQLPAPDRSPSQLLE